MSGLPDQAAFRQFGLLLSKLLGDREILRAVFVRLDVALGICRGLGLFEQFLVGEGLEAFEFELMELQRRLGMTFIIVTHDQEEAMTMADRIGVMDSGRLEQVATPRELYEAPHSRWVAEFVGDINMFEGQVESREASRPSDDFDARRRNHRGAGAAPADRRRPRSASRSVPRR